MATTAKATIHFMDGTKMALRYPRQAGRHSLAMADRVRQAIEADRLALEIKGNLVVIPLRNVKYVELSPAPDSLPTTVVRGAELV